MNRVMLSLENDSPAPRFLRPMMNCTDAAVTVFGFTAWLNVSITSPRLSAVAEGTSICEILRELVAKKHPFFRGFTPAAVSGVWQNVQLGCRSAFGARGR